MIPDFHKLMAPFMTLMSDGQEHPLSQVVDHLANVLQISPEERRQLLPSGQQELFGNRVQWARLYLYKAGLIDTPKRATYKITPRGLQILADSPGEIDRQFLMKFPEFAAFVRGSKSPTTTPDSPNAPASGDDVRTPEELIEEASQAIRRDLAEQLLSKLKTAIPSFFETVVLDLLLAMGYGGSRTDAAEIRGHAGDEGIDGVIKEDRLGLDLIYVQAKRWNDTTVGRPEIQRFVGALKGQRAHKGVFITTSSFSKEAIDYARRLDDAVVLVDGDKMAELMIDNGIGVSVVAKYEILRVDSDYFSEA